jgi:AraC-like DNA-binding protein
LSGVVLAVELAKYLSYLKQKLNYSFRFLFIPETIGAITWLARNQQKIKKIKHGLVITCVGDSGQLTYKKSRQGNSEIDQTVISVLKDSKEDFNLIDFFPLGSDERQYCSPGINLPVGSLMRTRYAEFPEYHTSADNLNFVKEEFKRPIPLEEIAELVNMTVPAFCRYFKKITGKTFVQFVNEYRLAHAAKLLHEKQISITDVCFESGFNNFSYFNKKFKSLTGKSPSTYRNELNFSIS